MTKIIFIVLTLSALSLTTCTALSCYACNDCGTTLDTAKATIVQTSTTNYYCRVNINFIINNTIFFF